MTGSMKTETRRERCGMIFQRAAAALAAILAASGPAPADETERPAFFTRLRDVAPDILQDMRYAGSFNFIGRRVEGYEAGECWLHEDAARALAQAQKALRADGLTLIVFDCYRPARAVRQFNDWLASRGLPEMRRVFHPDLDKAGVREGRYIARRSNHARGGAVDLALASVGYSPEDAEKADRTIRCDAPFEQRFHDTDLDFGTGYDCFSDRSHTASTDIPRAARRNRETLRAAMSEVGFRNYRREWWHFDYRAGDYPDVQWDFPVR